MKKTIVNIGFTCGPVGGKTTGIEWLMRRESFLHQHPFEVYTVPEIATLLEPTGIHPKHLPTMPNDLFQNLVAWRYKHEWDIIIDKINGEKSLTPLFPTEFGIILHDRTFIDQKLYCEGNEGLYESLEAKYFRDKIHQYNLVFHLTSLAVDNPILYLHLKSQNSARHEHETVEFAREMDGKLFEIYSQIPHIKLVRIGNEGEIEDKYQKVESEIRKYFTENFKVQF